MEDWWENYSLHCSHWDYTTIEDVDPNNPLTVLCIPHHLYTAVKQRPWFSFLSLCFCAYCYDLTWLDTQKSHRNLVPVSIALSNAVAFKRWLSCKGRLIPGDWVNSLKTGLVTVRQVVIKWTHSAWFVSFVHVRLLSAFQSSMSYSKAKMAYSAPGFLSVWNHEVR